MASSHVFIRPDGSERMVSGYRYKKPQPDAKRYTSSRNVAGLPPKVDLRALMTPVEDQGELSSCVANAVAGAYEYLVKRHRGNDAYDVSRLFIYYNARKREGAEHKDVGSVIADAIQSLREEGACSERTWPYHENKVNTEPKREAYQEASHFLVEDTQLVPTSLDAWRHALADGYPIIFGISLFDSFDKHQKKGLVPMPSARETARASHAGHAMLCVGYSDPDEVFIVRNSWGSQWGDQGYCFIPYQYLMNQKYNDGDSWIIRQLQDVDEDAGTWGNDTTLIGDFPTELAKMTKAEYQAMIDAMGHIHLETRLALIFLCAAGSDSEISDDELDGISQYVTRILRKLGSPYHAGKVLRYAKSKYGDQRALKESIRLLGAHLPIRMRASILHSLREIIGVDDVSEQEEAFLDHLVEVWQIEDNMDEEDDMNEDLDEDEEDEDEEDEEEEEEDEEEEDEEDEDEEDEDEEEEDEEDEDEEEEDEEDEDEEEEDEDDEDEEDEDEEDEDEDEEDD